MSDSVPTSISMIPASRTPGPHTERWQHTAESFRTRDRAMRRGLAFIEAHLGERFSLETLAGAAGISRFHFARMFRLATGCSPMQYLMRRRVERGQLLLAAAGMSICDVAALLGFSDQSHFTRSFRRVTGMSPREYLRSQTDH